MSNRIIRWIIPIIPTIILLACIVAAFATNDWNVQATLFAEDPVKTAESLSPFTSGAGSEFLKIKDYDISGDRITIEFEVTSPVNMPITIEEFSADIAIGDGTSTISLPEAVTIPAKGSGILNLEGVLPDIQTISDPRAMEGTKDVPIRSVSMKFDLSGIKLEIKKLGSGI